MVLDRDKIWKLHQSGVRSRSTKPGACSPEFPPETRTHFGEAILIILCVGGFISISKVASTENLQAWAQAWARVDDDSPFS